MASFAAQETGQSFTVQKDYTDTTTPDLTFELNDLPTATSNFVLRFSDPEDSTQAEWMFITSVHAGNKQVICDNAAKRGLQLDATNCTLTTILANTAGILANRKEIKSGWKAEFVNFHADINDKATLSATNDFSGGDQDVSAGNVNMADAYGLSWDSDNIRVFRDGDDLKMMDNNQAVVTLSTLAAAAGVDDKVKVSTDDTTAGYLDDKIIPGDGISETLSGAGDETMTLAVDIAATNDLQKITGGELDTNLTATKAQLDEAGTFFGATDISGAEAETLTDGSNADALHVHAYTNTFSGLTTDTYSITSSTTEDYVIAAGFQPTTIELFYELTGETDSAAKVSFGTATYNGTTLKFNHRTTVNDVASYSVVATAPTAGSAGGGAAEDLQIDITILAVSATGFTIRATLTYGGDGDAAVGGIDIGYIASK